MRGRNVRVIDDLVAVAAVVATTMAVLRLDLDSTRSEIEAVVLLFACLLGVAALTALGASVLHGRRLPGRARGNERRCE